MSFSKWWLEKGSAIRPLSFEDQEEFASRIAEIAWRESSYVEREACAIAALNAPIKTATQPIREACANAIRARK